MSEGEVGPANEEKHGIVTYLRHLTNGLTDRLPDC